MSDVHGAAPAAGSKDQVSEAPDDGFTAEERAQFADMENTTSAPPADAPIEPAAGEPAAGAAAPAGDDDDDDGEAAAGAAGAPGAADDGTRKPRRVSFSKYDRETKELRDALAKANATVSEKNETMARFDERMKIINEALATPLADPAAEAAAAAAAKAPPLPKAEDDPEPDPEQDIFAHNQWLKRSMLRMQQDVNEGRQQTQQERQAETAERQTTDTYLRDAEAFAGAEPNFGPAYQFLMASRVAELAVHYFDKDVTSEKITPEEYALITKTIVKEEKQIVATAIKAGKSPAKKLFTIAKSRGFRPGAPAAAAAAAAPAANGKGAPAPLAAAPASAGGVVEEIRRVASGQDAALSLSGGGGAPAPVMDAARLANMPQAEFERWMDETPPDQIRKLMGG